MKPLIWFYMWLLSPVLGVRGWNSCAQIREEEDNAKSGIYHLSQPQGTEIEVYCEFHDDHGYVFIANDDVSSVLSLNSLTSSRPTDALLRFKYNDQLYETVIGQLPRFQHLPVSYQVNSYDNYTNPVKYYQYLYLGLIPAQLNGKGTLAGYTANGHLYEFTNCDGNPNSYFVFYVVGPNTGNMAGNSRPWMTNKRKSTTILQNQFFYAFEEHQGGCGVLFRSTGAAIGLKFEMPKKGWNSCAQIREEEDNAQSGIYHLSQPKGTEIEVYCEFHDDHGYVFIANNEVSSDLSLNSLTSSRPTDALLRFKYNDQQYETVIGQLPRFQHLPVSYQINSFDNFTNPSKPYQNLFLGLIPAQFNGKGTLAGYSANGHLYEFTNCDGNPNSYFVFYVVESHTDNVAGNSRPWMVNKRKSTIILPNKFFYTFEEHQGGCGVLFRSTGAAIGLKFEMKTKGWNSCAQIREEEENAKSGVYYLSQPTGTEIEVYCEFHDDYGYVFIANNEVSSDLSLNSLTSSRPTDALLRFKYNDQQYETVIGQLPRFQHLPVSYQINSFDNYTNPAKYYQYLFLGLIPAQLNGKRTLAGYTANGHMYEFTNCDGNPNSYFVFYVVGPHTGNMAGNSRPWMTNKRKSTIILLNQFFYAFEEHQGGCGALFRSTGAAIGLKFELPKKGNNFLRTKLADLERLLNAKISFTNTQYQQLNGKVDDLMKEKQEMHRSLEVLNTTVRWLETENRHLRMNMTSMAAIFSICLNNNQRSRGNQTCLALNTNSEPVESSTDGEMEVLRHTMKINVRPTCHDWKQLGFLRSGYYNIDPDGIGFGEPSFVVYCDMLTGYTFVHHDSEEESSLVNCVGEGCYTKRIVYNATKAQIGALKDGSYSCQQFIKVECLGSPFISNDRILSWWTGGDGQEHSFWSGDRRSNTEDHICTCGLLQSCLDPRLRCNCDSNVADVWLHDKGYITDLAALPVNELHFGGTSTNIRHSLGPLRCFGRKPLAFPQSCAEAMMDGGARRGYYVVGNLESLKLAFCDVNVPDVTTYVMDLSEMSRNVSILYNNPTGVN